MPQAKPIQRQPMLPTFLDTSQETVRTSSNRNPGLKDLFNSVFVLQITSGHHPRLAAWAVADHRQLHVQASRDLLIA
jgi:hypothetical protein